MWRACGGALLRGSAVWTQARHGSKAKPKRKAVSLKRMKRPQTAPPPDAGPAAAVASDDAAAAPHAPHLSEEAAPVEAAPPVRKPTRVKQMYGDRALHHSPSEWEAPPWSSAQDHQHWRTPGPDPALQGLDDFFEDVPQKKNAPPTAAAAQPPPPAGELPPLPEAEVAPSSEWVDPPGHESLQVPPPANDAMVKALGRFKERKIQTARRKKRKKAQGAAEDDAAGAAVDPVLAAELAQAFPSLRKVARRLAKKSAGARPAAAEAEAAALPPPAQPAEAAAAPADAEERKAARQAEELDAVAKVVAAAEVATTKKRLRKKGKKALGFTSEVPQINPSRRSLAGLAKPGTLPASTSLPMDEPKTRAELDIMTMPRALAYEETEADEEAAPVQSQGRRFKDVMMESVERATDDVLLNKGVAAAELQDVPEGSLEDVEDPEAPASTRSSARDVQDDVYVGNVPRGMPMDRSARVAHYHSVFHDGHKHDIFIGGEGFQRGTFLPMQGFSEAIDTIAGDFAAQILAFFRKWNITFPTTVQRYACPLLFEGRSMILQAPTGTGKTITYALAALNAVAASRRFYTETRLPPMPVAIISVPHDFAAKQVMNVVRGMAPRTVRVKLLLNCDDGVDNEHQNQDILIGTHTALGKVMYGKLFPLRRLRCLIIDEADTLEGFHLHRFTSALPRALEADFDEAKRPQVILAAATQVVHPAWQALETEVAQSKFLSVRVGGSGLNEDTFHKFVMASVSGVGHAVVRQFEEEIDILTDRTLIVVANKQHVPVRDALVRHGRTLHGSGVESPLLLLPGLDEDKQNRHIAMFRKGQANVLITTANYARAIDVPDCTNVIVANPMECNEWVHTVGRCSRAGRRGRAITVVSPHDFDVLPKIFRTLKQTHPANPALDEILGVSRGVKKRTTEIRRSEQGAYTVRTSDDGEEGLARKRIDISPDVIDLALKAEAAFASQAGKDGKTYMSNMRRVKGSRYDDGESAPTDRFDPDVKHTVSPLVRKSDVARQVKERTQRQLLSGGFLRQAKNLLRNGYSMELLSQNTKAQQVLLSAKAELNEMDRLRIQKIAEKAEQHKKQYKVSQVIKWRERTGITDPSITPKLALPNVGGPTADPLYEGTASQIGDGQHLQSRQVGNVSIKREYKHQANGKYSTYKISTVQQL